MVLNDSESVSELVVNALALTFIADIDSFIGNTLTLKNKGSRGASCWAACQFLGQGRVVQRVSIKSVSRACQAGFGRVQGRSSGFSAGSGQVNGGSIQGEDPTRLTF